MLWRAVGCALLGAMSAQPRKLAALFAALALAYLALSGPAPPFHGDSVSDYRLALLCLDGSGCMGHEASDGRLSHGRGFTLLLAASVQVGLGPTGLHWVMLVLQALAVGVGIRALSGEVPGRRERWGGAFLIGATAMAVSHPQLWSPGLTPLPLALFYLCLRRFAEGRGLPTLVAASVALGFAIDAHVLGVLLVPGLAAIAAWRSGPTAAILATLVPLGVHAAISPTELLINADRLGGLGVVLVLITAQGALATEAGRRLRATLGALPEREVPEAVFLVMGASFGALLLLGILVVGHSLALRYLLLVLVPLAFALGSLTERRWPRALAALIVVAVLIPPATGALAPVKSSSRYPLLTLAQGLDASRTLAAIVGLGGREHLEAVVQAPNRGSLGRLFDALPAQGEPQPRRVVRLLAPHREVTAPGSFTRTDSGLLLSTDLEPWVRTDTVEVCLVPGPCEAIGAPFESGVRRLLGQPTGGEHPQRIEYRHAVSPSGPDAYRDLELLRPPNSKWQLRGGISARVPRHAAPPHLVLSLDLRDTHENPARPPSLFELRPSEGSIRALLYEPSPLTAWFCEVGLDVAVRPMPDYWMCNVGPLP